MEIIIMDKDTGKKLGWLKYLMIAIFAVALGTIVIIAVVQNGKTEKNVDETTQSKKEKWQEGVIQYCGNYYKYNNKIKTYLLLGVDSKGEVQPTDVETEGGQSDAMFLLVQNVDEQRLDIVAINRNSMVEVDMYGPNGDSLGTKYLQICLQHAYGDGEKKSCQRTVKAVSRMFHDIPISGYLSLNMEGMAEFNDAIGGVEVTVPEDLVLPNWHTELHQGETKVLSGQEAYTFLRYRDVNEFNSATKRLERQKLYVSSMIKQLKRIAGGSKSKAVEVFDKIKPYTVTDISIGEFALELGDYQVNEAIYSIPGEMQEGTLFEEYIVDEEALYQMILDIFYNPIEKKDGLAE